MSCSVLFSILYRLVHEDRTESKFIALPSTECRLLADGSRLVLSDRRPYASHSLPLAVKVAAISTLFRRLKSNAYCEYFPEVYLRFCLLCFAYLHYKQSSQSVHFCLGATLKPVHCNIGTINRWPRLLWSAGGDKEPTH